jgi:glycosyltransferase involved in cell wall biosynthesis
VHGHFHRTFNKGLLKFIASLNERISLAFMKSQTDLFFVINEDIRDALINKGFLESKIVLVNNGVDPIIIDSLEANESDWHTEFDACFCGRLVKLKGVYDLIEIWRNVVKIFPKSKLLVLGDGSEYDNIQKIIKQDDSIRNNIILKGFIKDEKQKFQYIKSSKVFVFPSFIESWGVAICEAMACGLPVVCYDLPSYGVFRDGIVRIKEMGDINSMTEAIIDLLSQKEKRLEYGHKAKKITKLLRWDHIAVFELNEIRKRP